MAPAFFFDFFGGYSRCYATHLPCHVLDDGGAL